MSVVEKGNQEEFGRTWLVRCSDIEAIGAKINRRSFYMIEK
jgi:hypothetical protein